MVGIPYVYPTLLVVTMFSERAWLADLEQCEEDRYRERRWKLELGKR